MSGQVYPIKCRIRNEDGGVTRVDVYDDIGGGGWFDEGVTAKSFAGQMAKVKGPLEVHVNSGGGEVHDGIAIGNAIRSHKGPVSVVVDGIAASIASVIVQAGQDRIMQPGSMMMIHDASTLCYGDEAEMVKTAEVLAKNSDNIASIYADRAGGTPEQWRETMRAETWYTAEEAVSAGLADRVGDGAAELPAGMDLTAFAAVPGRIAARLRKMPQAAVPRAAGAPAVTDTGSAPVPVLDTQDPIRDDAQGACCSACGPDCACGGQPQGHQDQAALQSWLKKEIRAAVKKETRAAAKASAKASRKASRKPRTSATEDHKTADTSGIDLEQIRAALKGANA
jgi:ATP-dependent protease ClpP protease subunit